MGDAAESLVMQLIKRYNPGFPRVVTFQTDGCIKKQASVWSSLSKMRREKIVLQVVLKLGLN